MPADPADPAPPTAPPDPAAVAAAAVARGEVPGAVAVHGGPDGPGPVTAHGVRREGGPAVTADTRYDLASLTKVVATLPAVLRLVAAGELELDAPLRRWLPSAAWMQASPHLGEASPRRLLAHASGLPAWRPLFAQAPDRLTATAAVLQAPLAHAPGTVVYSDLGFLALGALVEAVAGERLDAFARRELFAPLGMTATGFGPVRGAPVAATERCAWRGRLLEGEVHDENAWAMEGVAGHAGLFGTAADLGRYAAAWLRRDPLLGPEPLLEEALRPQGEGSDPGGGRQRRGLGWLLAPHPTAGRSASARAYGHTGFTGTSLWIDPERARWAVLLTNRVHPRRDRLCDIAALRGAYADAVWATAAEPA